MVCLGAEMSEAMGTALATDTPAFSPGGEYLLYGEPPAPSNSPVSSSLLFRLGIEFPSPKALTNLSMKRLVKFHSKRADERRRFRAAVDSLAAAAADLADENALADFLSSNKAELQQALSDHKKSLEELAVTALVSSIDIKVPALLTGGIAMAPFDQLVSLILAGTGITCGLIQWWAQLRSDRRKLVQSCAWHYCLSAKGI